MFVLILIGDVIERSSRPKGFSPFSSEEGSEIEIIRDDPDGHYEEPDDYYDDRDGGMDDEDDDFDAALVSPFVRIFFLLLVC